MQIRINFYIRRHNISENFTNSSNLQQLYPQEPEMKNTLKIVLIVIGLGFFAYSIYNLIFSDGGSPEERRQLYGMLGVGVLFLLGGVAMGKR